MMCKNTSTVCQTASM